MSDGTGDAATGTGLRTGNRGMAIEQQLSQARRQRNRLLIHVDNLLQLIC